MLSYTQRPHMTANTIDLKLSSKITISAGRCECAYDKRIRSRTRGLFRYVGTRQTHGQADMGRLEGRTVIGTVPSHGHHVSVLLQPIFNECQYRWVYLLGLNKRTSPPVFVCPWELIGPILAGEEESCQPNCLNARQ